MNCDQTRWNAHNALDDKSDKDEGYLELLHLCNSCAIIIDEIDNPSHIPLLHST